MALDQATVKHIATLARLKLSDERIGPMQKDLNHILHFIDQLNEADTSSVQDNVAEGVHMPFRQDRVSDGECLEKVLSNAPEMMCNMFVVPKVVE